MRSLWAVTVAVVGLNCACHRPRADGAEVEILVGSEPATLDPRYATRALDVKLTRLVHAGLVALDPNTLEPKPYLAASIERSGELGIDVELAQGAHFHGGQPLTPNDVCATLAAIGDPAVMSPHRTVASVFASCRPQGGRSLHLELRTPRASYLSDLEIPILRADEARLGPKFDGELDGLGPFRVASRTDGVIRLEGAENGVRGRPRHPVVIRTVHDENARAMRLLSGRAEIAPNAFSPSLLSGFEHDGRDIAVTSRPGANVTYLLIRCDRAPFDDVRVREGLSSAIDRDAIVKSLLSGKARAAKWLIPDGHWAAPRDLSKLEYAPERARRALANHGPVTLLTSTDRSRILQARAVAQMLTDAGLATSVVPLDLGLLLSRLDDGRFTLAILQIPELTEPNILSWFFHPRGIASAGAQGRNRGHYASPRAAELLDRASSTFDRGERARLYADLADVMLADMPVVPLWHEDQIVVARGRGKAFLPSAEGRWLSLADL